MVSSPLFWKLAANEFLLVYFFCSMSRRGEKDDKKISKKNQLKHRWKGLDPPPPTPQRWKLSWFSFFTKKTLKIVQTFLKTHNKNRLNFKGGWTRLPENWLDYSVWRKRRFLQEKYLWDVICYVLCYKYLFIESQEDTADRHYLINENLINRQNP